MRPSQRKPDQLRAIRITRHYTKHAEGSVLIECGDTKVICTASVEERVLSHPGVLSSLRVRGAVLQQSCFSRVEPGLPSSGGADSCFAVLPDRGEEDGFQ